MSKITHHGDTPPFGQAVVIGSSMTGLAAARVLADHFDRVTVIERDFLPNIPGFRRGVPQARHAHLLLPQGQSILEQHFPGLTADLAAKGATLIDKDLEMQESPDGVWFDNVTSLICSRPLLENTLYQRLAANSKVHFLQGFEAVGLDVNRQRQRVTGIRLRNRQSRRSAEVSLPADLVVDASGRGSRTPHWLAGLGYPLPTETTVNSFSVYTSRIYRRLSDEPWKMMRITPTPPDKPRGGMIVPLEADRWIVTLIGRSHNNPPNDEAGFLAFAQSLPSRQMYKIITAAEPLSDLYSFRGTKNRLRHYDKLPQHLEGFLVCGDAVCALSPVHALGMTAAAIGSQTLADCLTAQQHRGDLTGLARTFQQRLRRDIDPVWQKVTDSDRRWPATKVAQEIAPANHRRARAITQPFPLPVAYGLA